MRAFQEQTILLSMLGALRLSRAARSMGIQSLSFSGINRAREVKFGDLSSKVNLVEAGIHGRERLNTTFSGTQSVPEGIHIVT